MSEGRGTVMLVGVVAVAAWAATSKPVVIPTDGQRLQIEAQYQAKDSVNRNQATEYLPPGLENRTGQLGGETGDQRSPEVTFLGVKPGEWLIAFVTALLWYATMRLVWDARETSKRQLRAYVHNLGVQWFWHVDPTNNRVWYSFKPEFKNLGGTPAHGVKVFTARYFEIDDIPETFPFQTDVVPPSIAVGPQASFAGAEIAVTGNDLVQVQMGTMHLLIWGWAKYRDTFAGTPERSTKFCVRVSLRGNPLVVPSETAPLVMSFAFHTHHNEAT